MNQRRSNWLIPLADKRAGRAKLNQSCRTGSRWFCSLVRNGTGPKKKKKRKIRPPLRERVRGTGHYRKA